MAVIKSGTVSIAVGSTAVVGTGTTWASGPKPARAGDTFMVPGAGFVSTIAAVTSDTELTLVTARAGSAITGAAFEIRLDAPTRLSGVSAVAALAAQAVSLKVLERNVPLPKVVSVGGNAPPATPAVGTIYVVGSAPTGAWAGYALQYAYVESTGWRFAAPTLGDGACDLSTGDLFFWTGSSWIQRSLTVGSVRYDITQELTDAQKGQARANIDAGKIGGFRNKIINGDFLVAQAGTSHTSSGYGSADMWASYNVGTTKTTSVQAFTIGQTDVPGNPRNFLRTVVISVAGSNNSCQVVTAMEDVRELAGKKVTVTFWAKADSAKNIAVEMLQFFGTGGSPSSNVTGIGAQIVTLTSSWAKKSFVVDIPSIAGKTLGTNPNTNGIALLFWLDAGSSLSARASNLGQQSGTFDIAHVSVVEGDATAEADPFSPRHISQEFDLCSRYYWRPGQAYEMRGYAVGAGDVIYVPIYTPVMRVAPTVSKLNEVLGGAASSVSFAASAGGGGFMQINASAAGQISAAAIPVLDARM